MNSLESVEVNCPYCGQTIELAIDCSVEEQSYVEDCEVCCQPMTVSVSIDEEGKPDVYVEAEDE